MSKWTYVSQLKMNNEYYLLWHPIRATPSEEEPIMWCIMCAITHPIRVPLLILTLFVGIRWFLHWFLILGQKFGKTKRKRFVFRDKYQFKHLVKVTLFQVELNFQQKKRESTLYFHNHKFVLIYNEFEQEQNGFRMQFICFAKWTNDDLKMTFCRQKISASLLLRVWVRTNDTLIRWRRPSSK